MAETEDATATTETQTLEDIEQVVAESEAKGYFGETPEYDRDAYTLKTGPDSPSTLEATLEAKRADIDAQLDEVKANAKAKVEGAKGKVAEHRASRQARKES